VFLPLQNVLKTKGGGRPVRPGHKEGGKRKVVMNECDEADTRRGQGTKGGKQKEEGRKGHRLNLSLE